MFIQINQLQIENHNKKDKKLKIIDDFKNKCSIKIKRFNAYSKYGIMQWSWVISGLQPLMYFEIISKTFYTKRHDMINFSKLL